MATIFNPRPFRANRKYHEWMLSDFDLYTEAFANFLTVTDNVAVDSQKKKALLKLLGGQDMLLLFRHIGKAPDDATYENTITTIHAGLVHK